MTTEDLSLGIFRLGPQLVRVQVKGGTYLVKEEGVVCVNPDAEEKDRVYRKDFKNRTVYLPDEYELAMDKHVRDQKNVFVISMNGYSSLTPEWLKKYGIKNGAYEAACGAILERVIQKVRDEFSAVQIRIIDGASYMGVDGVIQDVAQNKFGLGTLGFSCPEFMMYVRDIEGPVYVAKDKAAYADSYIRSLDLLITTGGRGHALQHDTLAACVYDKRIHFVDVPNMLSEIPVPARIMDKNGVPTIENAAAAFGRNISFSDRDEIYARKPASGDQWNFLFDSLSSIAIGVARNRLDPRHMFQRP